MNLNPASSFWGGIGAELVLPPHPCLEGLVLQGRGRGGGEHSIFSAFQKGLVKVEKVGPLERFPFSFPCLSNAAAVSPHVVCVNNSGGGIFAFLPIARHPDGQGTGTRPVGIIIRPTTQPRNASQSIHKAPRGWNRFSLQLQLIH